MSESKWEEFRVRLIALDWRDETAEGIVGLSSPNDAMFIDPRVLDDDFRSMMMSGLSRQVGTIEGYKAKGFYPPEAERAHQDFQQALEVLAGIAED